MLVPQKAVVTQVIQVMRNPNERRKEEKLKTRRQRFDRRVWLFNELNSFYNNA